MKKNNKLPVNTKEYNDLLLDNLQNDIAKILTKYDTKDAKLLISFALFGKENSVFHGLVSSKSEFYDAELSHFAMKTSQQIQRVVDQFNDTNKPKFQ